MESGEKLTQIFLIIMRTSIHTVRLWSFTKIEVFTQTKVEHANKNAGHREL